MNSSEPLYIGIDPASGHKDFTYAALDDGLGLVNLDDATMDELLAFLGQQEVAVVAVNAPAGVNHGLVKDKLEAENTKPGRIFRGVDMRLAEYELRERGISVSGTASREEYCPAWVQNGFALYRKLSEMGFKPFGVDGTHHLFLETHAHACFCVLSESSPFPKPTLEGRLQRQLILNDRGLRISDAMSFFEEITRFKLMKGILPTDALYSLKQLDVLVTAYVAWLAACRPDEVIRVGDAGEGQVFLPARELREKY